MWGATARLWKESWELTAGVGGGGWMPQPSCRDEKARLQGNMGQAMSQLGDQCFVQVP